MWSDGPAQWATKKHQRIEFLWDGSLRKRRTRIARSNFIEANGEGRVDEGGYLVSPTQLSSQKWIDNPFLVGKPQETRESRIPRSEGTPWVPKSAFDPMTWDPFFKKSVFVHNDPTPSSLGYQFELITILEKKKKDLITKSHINQETISHLI